MEDLIEEIEAGLLEAHELVEGAAIKVDNMKAELERATHELKQAKEILSRVIFLKDKLKLVIL